MSLSAKVMSELLKFWPKLTAEECEQTLAEVRQKGEKTTPPPKLLKPRTEDTENGRIFYINEDPESKYLIFYIHGGAYRHDIVLPHWQLIEKLVRIAGAQVIVPAYRLIPFATYRESFDLIVPLYKKYCEACPDKKIILMGDSAGGGLSLTLAEYFKAEGIRMLKEAGADESVIRLRSLDTLAKVAEGDSTKILIPSDIQNMAGLLTSLKESVK